MLYTVHEQMVIALDYHSYLRIYKCVCVYNFIYDILLEIQFQFSTYIIIIECPILSLIHIFDKGHVNNLILLEL